MKIIILYKQDQSLMNIVHISILVLVLLIYIVYIYKQVWKALEYYLRKLQHLGINNYRINLNKFLKPKPQLTEDFVVDDSSDHSGCADHVAHARTQGRQHNTCPINNRPLTYPKRRNFI